MTYTTITYEERIGVALITLNRPERLNAWTPAMGLDIAAAMTAAATSPGVRAIVITGAGRGFCAGMDFAQLDEVEQNRARRRRTDLPPEVPRASEREDFQGLFTYFPSIGKPVIAAINGPAAGSGLVLALSCDVRFASEDAVLTTSFARRGLVAEHGIAWLLTQLAGTANALDLLLSGRKVTAAEGKAMGILNAVCPAGTALDAALAYAAEIAAECSPRSLRIIKRQVWNAAFETLAENTAVANRELLLSFESEDFAEATAARVQRRRPAFPDMQTRSMMGFASRLHCPVEVGSLSVSALRQLFDWYVGLNIPYETLSNIHTGVLVKDAVQMLGAVEQGGGGHCVEHSVLLAAVLADAGFDARIVNADYHDHRKGTVVRIAKPLVVVSAEGGQWICDPYYRTVVLPLPETGSHRDGEYEVTRSGEGAFHILRLQDGRPVDEDRADFGWTLDTRRRQFADRYTDFSPFGVTAPFYQVMRPVRTAIFYSPRHDRLIVAEGNRYDAIADGDLAGLDWIPERFRASILAALPTSRGQRAAALAFLEGGLFPPYYERLETGARPCAEA